MIGKYAVIEFKGTVKGEVPELFEKNGKYYPRFLVSDEDPAKELLELRRAVMTGKFKIHDVEVVYSPEVAPDIYIFLRSLGLGEDEVFDTLQVGQKEKKVILNTVNSILKSSVGGSRLKLFRNPHKRVLDKKRNLLIIPRLTADSKGTAFTSGITPHTTSKFVTIADEQGNLHITIYRPAGDTFAYLMFLLKGDKATPVFLHSNVASKKRNLSFRLRENSGYFNAFYISWDDAIFEPFGGRLIIVRYNKSGIYYAILRPLVKPVFDGREWGFELRLNGDTETFFYMRETFDTYIDNRLFTKYVPSTEHTPRFVVREGPWDCYVDTPNGPTYPFAFKEIYLDKPLISTFAYFLSEIEKI